MEDILNLFRRDDHHHDHPDADDLGAKVGVLRKDDSISTGMIIEGSRTREPVTNNGRVSVPRAEDSIYGRRW